MVHSNILREELDTEMTVVRNEFEMGENRPQWALYQKVFATAFMWHNYGNSTIGNRSDIENVGIDNLRAFYRTYYQPDNAVLLVASKIDSAKTGWIADYFGKVARPTRKLPKLWTVSPPGRRTRSDRAPGWRQPDTVPRPTASRRCPPRCGGDPVLMALMTSEPAGRLYQALVKSKLAVSVDNESDLMFDPTLVGFWVTLNKSQSVDKAREAMLATIESATRKPFTQSRARPREVAVREELRPDDRRQRAFRRCLVGGGSDWRLAFLLLPA